MQNRSNARILRHRRDYLRGRRGKTTSYALRASPPLLHDFLDVLTCEYLGAGLPSLLPSLLVRLQSLTCGGAAPAYIESVCPPSAICVLAELILELLLVLNPLVIECVRQLTEDVEAVLHPRGE